MLTVLSICLASMSPFGLPGAAAAIFTGSSFCGVILLARREDLANVIWVVFGATVGAAFGAMYLSPFLCVSRSGSYDVLEEIARATFAGSVIGTLGGGALGSWLARLDARSSKKQG